ncbi:hypothetical protein DPMN_023111 [Dreissena polymorpha]|uniref:FLYWCH-type domain-containing protein n=1 Tax=Dreissena polymorpha TaxID=45954 RepID=A0A9D4R9L8_DREPO|nr:hypothetical protein DPMN_023111 [Dreissena polymorpha]
MEIINNNKGGQKLCHYGYCYTKKAKSAVSQRWECDQRGSQKCRAIATTDLELTVVKSVTEHIHAADMFKGKT